MKCRFLPLLCAGLVLAGCGGSSSSTAGPNYTYSPSKAHVVGCAHAGKVVALPSQFPQQFPMPNGTLIDQTKKLNAKQIGIYGYVPSSSFANTVNFFKNQVPKAGFKVLDFEVDSPHDSEGTYQGHGSVGRWALQALAGCAAAMRFSASAERSS